MMVYFYGNKVEVSTSHLTIWVAKVYTDIDRLGFALLCYAYTSGLFLSTLFLFKKQLKKRV